MRCLSLLLVVLVAAGCGVSAEQTGAPGSSEATMSGDGTVPTLKTEVNTLEEPKIEAPPLLLVNPAGKQIGTPGSSCVQYENPATGEGSGACADAAAPVLPEKVSVVRPGESVSVLLAGAHVTGDGLVVIRPLGCANKEVGTFELPAGEPGAVSRIALDPGAYQLDVFARFASNDGRHGDLSGALGILVDPDQKRDILPARLFPVCQFPS